jgi:hypothetical protein
MDNRAAACAAQASPRRAKERVIEPPDDDTTAFLRSWTLGASHAEIASMSAYARANVTFGFSRPITVSTRF